MAERVDSVPANFKVPAVQRHQALVCDDDDGILKVRWGSIWSYGGEYFLGACNGRPGFCIQSYYTSSLRIFLGILSKLSCVWTPR